MNWKRGLYNHKQCKAISGFIRKKFPFAGNFNGKRGAMFLVT